jgi:hypothetical protein
MDQDSMVLKGRLDMGEFSVIDLPDGSKQGRKVLSNAFKIFNIHKEKWYSLVCPSPEEKEKWVKAFEEAGVKVERLNAYKIDQNAKLASNMLLTDEERMEIMNQVREGKMNVEEAMAQVNEREATLQEQYNAATAQERKKDLKVTDKNISSADKELDQQIEAMIELHNEELGNQLMSPPSVRERLLTSVIRTMDESLDSNIEKMIAIREDELGDRLVDPSSQNGNQTRERLLTSVVRAMDKSLDGEIEKMIALQEEELGSDLISSDNLPRERLGTTVIKATDKALDDEIEKMIAKHETELGGSLGRERLSTMALSTANASLDDEIEKLIEKQNAELDERDFFVKEDAANPYKSS